MSLSGWNRYQRCYRTPLFGECKKKQQKRKHALGAQIPVVNPEPVVVIADLDKGIARFAVIAVDFYHVWQPEFGLLGHNFYM